MKKFLNLLLVALFAIIIAVPAVSAEDEKGSIKVTSAVSGEDYTLYQILKAESYSTTESGALDKVAYFSSTSDWTNFLENYKGTDGENAFTKVTKAGDTSKTYWTYNDNIGEADIKAFADAALAYAKDPNNKITGTTITASSSNVEFTNLDLGYYLVESSIGSILHLTHSMKNVEITEKNNTTPVVDKKDMTDEENPTNLSEHNIGDVIPFDITLTNVGGLKNVVVTDTMTSGLTYNNDVKVTVNGTEVSASDSTFTVSPTTVTPGATLTVTFNDAYMHTVAKDATIVISYSATLNVNAQTTGPEKNTVVVDFGNKQQTTKKEVDIYTHEFTFHKVDQNKEGLSGAKFTLTDSEGNTVYFIKTTVKEGTESAPASYKYTVTTANAGGATSEIMADIANIYGLAEGTYTLTETAAPEDYNILGAPIEVVITATENNDGSVTTKVTYDGVETESFEFNVVNTKGTVLPSTGGMGTVLFVTLGSLLVMATGVVLITKFRMIKEN